MFIKTSNVSKEKADQIVSACIECNICRKNCVMLQTYSETPKKLFMGQVELDAAYGCHLCDYCESVCPKSINLKEAFLSLRQDAQNNKQRVNTLPVDFHQHLSFSKVMTKKSPGKRVFFPGCALSAYDPSLVQRIYDDLNDGNLALWHDCCGNPTHTLGKISRFNNQIERLKSDFDKAAVTEVIVACQNCYMTFSKHLDIKVTSLYELIQTKKHLDLNEVALHDPCPTRYQPHIHEAARQLLDNLGVDYVEFDLNRENTLCCGSGAMVSVTNSKLASLQKTRRANQTDKAMIVSYCQECVESMRLGGKQAIHLLDLVYKEAHEWVFDDNQSSLVKWLNRVNLNNSIKNIK